MYTNRYLKTLMAMLIVISLNAGLLAQRANPAENYFQKPAMDINKEEIKQKELAKSRNLKRRINNGEFAKEVRAKREKRGSSASRMSGDKFKVPENNLTPEVADINPNSQGLVNRVQVTNNEYNGNPNVSIDITELKSYDMTLPVQLKYNRAGIKVDELGSAVGHGFDISTGGKLTRVVNGLPDEFIGNIKKYVNEPDETIYSDINSDHYGFQEIFGFGFLHPSSEFADPVNFGSWDGLKKRKAIKYSDWRSIPFYDIGNDDDGDWGFPKAIDLMPDDFYYEVGGYSGTFRFSDSDGTILKSDRDVRITMIDQTDASPNLGFVITTPEGNVYTFGHLDEYLETIQNTSITLNNYYANIVYECGSERFGFNCDGDGFHNVSYPTPAMPSYIDGEYGVGQNGEPIVTNSWHPYNYLNNPYTVLQSPAYVSDFLLQHIESPTGDNFTFTYDSPDETLFTTGKNYSYNSPSIEETDYNASMGSFDFTATFLTTENNQELYEPWVEDPDVSVPFYPTLYSFSYTYTVARAVRRRLVSITAENGYSIDFAYTKTRPDVVSDFLLTDIHLKKGFQPVQSWRLDYMDDYMGDNFEEDYEANQNWYVLNYFEPFDSEAATNFFPDPLTMTDFGSLEFILAEFHVIATDENELFYTQDISDNLEDVFKAEFDRSFLSSITQVGYLGSEIELNSFDYNSGALPKRFHYEQDIWGYHNNNTSGYHFPTINNATITFTPPLFDLCNPINVVNFRLPYYAFVNLDAPGIDGVDYCSIVHSYRNYNDNIVPSYSSTPDALGQNRSLQSITYHTGVIKAIEYETNTYSDDATADGSGLRVRRLTTVNPGSPTLEETYTYEETTPGSMDASGNVDIFPKLHLDGRELFELPNWGWLYRFDGYEPMRLIGSKPFNQMTNQGSGITGYGKVTKDILNHGKIVTSYHTGINYAEPTTYRIWSSSGGSPAAYPNLYHITGADLALDAGTYGIEGVPDTIQFFDENDSKVKEIINNFGPSTGLQYFKHFTAWTPDYDSGSTTSSDSEYYYTSNINFLTDEPILSSSIEREFADDGSGEFVETTTNYSYNSHYNVTEVEQQNSDGIMHTMTYEYAPELTAEDGFASTMVSRNMVGIPLRTQANGLKGSWVRYTSWSGEIKPFSIWESESGGWDWEITIDEYFKHSLPASISKVGFDPEVFTYSNDGLLLSKSYLDRSTTFLYHPTKRYLISKTDEDLQTTKYQADDLLRTTKVLSRDDTRKSEITYAYGAGNNSNTSVNTISGVNFVPDVITNYDGLGNWLSTVSVGYAADGGDFATSQTLDALGNVLQTCDPSAGGCTSNTYEASPLGRLQTTTAPGWPVTVQTQNLANGAGEVSNYAAGTLFKQVVIDEDQNETHIFKDKIGQTVLVRQFDNSNAIDTRYVYNLKGDLTTVIQPQGDEFNYVYYPDGNLYTKHVPGTTGNFIYTYYDDDLVQTVTDPNGVTITYVYDEYKQVKVVHSSEDGLIIDNSYYGVEEGKTGKLESRKVKMIKTGDFVTEEFKYDDFGRPSNSSINSELQGAQMYRYDQYDPRDLLKKRYISYASGPWNNPSSLKYSSHAYDHGGRLKTTYFDMGFGGTIPVSNLVYNNNDWVIQKNLGGTSAGNALQIVDYEYNSRGLLTKINGIDDVRQSKPWGDCEEPACADGGGIPIDHKVLLELLENQGTGVLTFDCHLHCISEVDNDGPVVKKPKSKFDNSGELLFDANEYSILGCDLVQGRIERDCEETTTEPVEPRSVERNNFLSIIGFESTENHLEVSAQNALGNTLVSNGLVWENQGKSGGLVWEVGENIELTDNEEVSVDLVNVNIQVAKTSNLKEMFFGLTDGSSLLPLKEKSEETIVSGTSIVVSSNSQYATLSLSPAVALSRTQLNNLRLVGHIRSGKVAIESVTTEVTTTRRCPEDCTKKVICDEGAYSNQQVVVPKIQKELDALKATAVTYPLTLVRVRLCNQLEIYITESKLQALGPEGSYAVLDFVEVAGPSQFLWVETSAGAENRPFGDFLLGAANKVDLSTVTNINKYVCTETTPPPPPYEPEDCPPLECTASQKYWQNLAYDNIQNIVAGMTAADITSDDLHLILLCSGEQVYILDQHLFMLPQEYIILQTINIDLDQGDIVVSGSATNYLNDLFAMNIFYNDGNDSAVEATPKFNGNISSMEWQAANGPVQSYGFQYDGLNRLTRAKFNDRNQEGFYTNSDRYTLENVSYSPNGNITNLIRRGAVGNCTTDYSVGRIDELTYIYDSQGDNNQLQSIRENVMDPDLRIRGFNPGGIGEDYDYDNNGNMIVDEQKGLTVVIDNHLNLPEHYSITKNGNSFQIDLHYDYLGRLWRKELTGLTSGNLVIDYIEGNEYQNNVWSASTHSEGRLVPRVADEGPTHYSQFVIKDHLENSRVVFGDWNGDRSIQIADNETTGDPKEVFQIDHYYPFGMQFGGDFTNPGELEELKYQYNGKENNNYGNDTDNDKFKDVALNLSDYGARWYDAAVGRWTGVDPLTEKYASASGYNYTMNNPIKNYDPDGKRLIAPNAASQRLVMQAVVHMFGANHGYSFNAANNTLQHDGRDMGGLSVAQQIVFNYFNTAVVNSERVTKVYANKSVHSYGYGNGQIGFVKLRNRNVKGSTFPMPDISQDVVGRRVNTELAHSLILISPDATVNGGNVMTNGGLKTTSPGEVLMHELGHAIVQSIMSEFAGNIPGFDGGNVDFSTLSPLELSDWAIRFTNTLITRIRNMENGAGQHHHEDARPAGALDPLDN